MLLNHIAAVLVFSGPLFWFGLWLAVDPAGVEGLTDFLVGVPRRIVQLVDGSTFGTDHERGDPGIARRHRRTLRRAGVLLVLLAIVI